MTIMKYGLLPLASDPQLLTSVDPKIKPLASRVTNATVIWPETRKLVKFGTITLNE